MAVKLRPSYIMLFLQPPLTWANKKDSIVLNENICYGRLQDIKWLKLLKHRLLNAGQVILPLSLHFLSINEGSNNTYHTG